MDRAAVQAWLDRYVEAWRANSREPIAALFSDDVVYRFAPYGEKNERRGLEAVVDEWLREPDAPESWEAHYEPFAVDGDRAVATGWSSYAATESDGARRYQNVFLMRFTPDGRCAEFTELYMREQPS
ncbi:MAG TPA: nuclear transport factor 2 family protein [Candidatus Limnocylindria bacterium]|nr:nuclear transport factor 2 family protein [Candidatus Limnocylindria bacterium]